MTSPSCGNGIYIENLIGKYIGDVYYSLTIIARVYDCKNFDKILKRAWHLLSRYDNIQNLKYKRMKFLKYFIIDALQAIRKAIYSIISF